MLRSPVSDSQGVELGLYVVEDVVGDNLATTDSYSGKFIPAVWSAKLNAKFYAASVYGEIANTDWQGEVSSMGDKVYINTAPTLTVSNYVAGQNLTYQVPTPDMQELLIDKGKYFAFQINDVLEYQSKPNLMDMFSTDAAEQMRIAIDSTVTYNTFSLAAAANKGATAGAKSASYNLGTDAAPVTLTAANVVQKVLELASTLDEQNVPESDRWLVIDPATRALLFQSELAKAYSTGDATSPVRNGTPTSAQDEMASVADKILAKAGKKKRARASQDTYDP